MSRKQPNPAAPDQRPDPPPAPSALTVAVKEWLEREGRKAIENILRKDEDEARQRVGKAQNRLLDFYKRCQDPDYTCTQEIKYSELEQAYRSKLKRGQAAEGKTMSFRYELGVTARDVVTGYEGVITSRCDYITGCKQYVLNAKGLHEGKPICGQWFDEDRLEVDDTVQPLRLGLDEPRRAAVGGPQTDSPPIK